MSWREWIPEELPFSGDWPAYEEVIYEAFAASLVRQTAMHEGLPVRMRWEPMHKGKPACFWHLIQEGKLEEQRTPDLQRCKHVKWTRAIIDHAAEDCVLVWENERAGSGGVNRQRLLWLEEADFLVVLGRRNGYWLLLTAYPTNRDHTRRKLRKEHDDYHRKKAGPAF